MVGDFLLPIPLTWTTKNFKIVKSRLRKLNPFGSVSSFELTILGTVTVLQCSKYKTFQIFLIQPNYTMKHPCVDLWVNRWTFFKDIWMIYSDFEWIKILLDMCFVIDDPIVCQIASYYKWNYNRIHSILHNFRYYLRKCDHNNVSFQSFKVSKNRGFWRVSGDGQRHCPVLILEYLYILHIKSRHQLTKSLRLSNFSNDGIKNLKISSNGNNDENLSRFSLIITFFWIRIIK